MSTNRKPGLPDGTYRALVGERAFDVAFRDGHLYVDDTPVAYTFEAISEDYYALTVEGRSFPFVVEVPPDASGRMHLRIQGRPAAVQVKDERALLLERFGLDEEAGLAEREVRAPMPGLVLRVLVEPGQEVQAGDGLVVLEAMKMENELRALTDGVVKTVHATSGEAVGKNELLVELE